MPSVSAQPSQNPEKKIFLAVLDLTNNAGLKTEECSTLSDTVRQELFSAGKYRIVDRKNMDQIFKEQGFQVSDCTSEECIVKIGQLLGVEKMAFCSIGRLEKKSFGAMRSGYLVWKNKRRQQTADREIIAKHF